MAILYVFFLYYMLIIFICNLKSICEIKICGFKLNFGIILVYQFEILWFFFSCKICKIKNPQNYQQGNWFHWFDNCRKPLKKTTDGLYFNIFKNHKLIIKC